MCETSRVGGDFDIGQTEARDATTVESVSFVRPARGSHRGVRVSGTNLHAILISLFVDKAWLDVFHDVSCLMPCTAVRTSCVFGDVFAEPPWDARISLQAIKCLLDSKVCGRGYDMPATDLGGAYDRQA